jgi:hypothetical protein
VLRKWAADAEDPLALLALMAEGEDPALIVEKLRQALHDVPPEGARPLRLPEPRCALGNALKHHTRPCGPGCEYPA